MTLKILAPRDNSTIRPKNRKVAGLVFYDGTDALRAIAVNLGTGRAVKDDSLDLLGRKYWRFSFAEDFPDGNYVVLVTEKGRGGATVSNSFRVAPYRNHWGGAGSPDIVYPKANDTIYMSPLWACGTSPDRFNLDHPEYQVMTPTDPSGAAIGATEVIWDAEWFFAKFELSEDGIYKLEVQDVHDTNPPPPDTDEELDIEVDLS